MCNLLGVYQIWTSLGVWVVGKASGCFPCYATVVCDISRRDTFHPSLLLLICKGVYQPVDSFNGD